MTRQPDLTLKTFEAVTRLEVKVENVGNTLLAVSDKIIALEQRCTALETWRAQREGQAHGAMWVVAKVTGGALALVGAIWTLGTAIWSIWKPH